MDSVAVTDHGNMFGTIDFYKKAKEAGVKPIFGCETYVSATTAAGQDRAQELPPHPARQERRGLQEPPVPQLEGYLEGFYYHPRIDKQLLKEHSRGPDRPVRLPRRRDRADALREGYDKAKEAALEYTSLFEAGHLLPRGAAQRPRRAGAGQRLVAEDGARDRASPSSPPATATTCKRERREGARHPDVHPAGQDPARPEAAQAPHAEPTTSSRPRSSTRSFSDIPEALENTVKIADALQRRAEARQDLSADVQGARGLRPRQLHAQGRRRRPRAPLRRASRRAATSSMPISTASASRSSSTSSCKMGFSGYFLIVWDFINWAKEQRHPRRPGPRLGRRLARRVLAAHHRPRSDPVQPAVRALPQPRARLDARLRRRLLHEPARRGHRVRHREVRQDQRRADRHLAPAQGARRDPRRRAA